MVSIQEGKILIVTCCLRIRFHGIRKEIRNGGCLILNNYQEGSMTPSVSVNEKAFAAIVALSMI